MDFEDSVFLLKNILASELDPTSARNRHWAMQLACVSPAEAIFSVKLAKAIGGVLAHSPIVLRIPRNSVALYNAVQLHRLGVEKLAELGAFQYYAMAKPPDRLLFRKKKATSGKPDENAAVLLGDIRASWVEVLPYEIRVINNKLIIRGAEWLERLRHETEYNILRIGNPEEWKKASKKERAKLEYCSISAFDRISVIDLLRKNLMSLTPKAEYYFHAADAEVNNSTPKALHRQILAVSEQNRYRYFPLTATTKARRAKAKAQREKKTELIKD